MAPSTPTKEDGLEVLGVFFSAGATFAGSFGDNCVKLAYNKVYRDEALSLEGWQGSHWLQSEYFCITLLWLFGWFSTIVGNTTLNAFALMYAPASLVSRHTGPSSRRHAVGRHACAVVTRARPQVTPMTALHMVWNVWLSIAMNDEQISRFVMVRAPCKRHTPP